MMERAERLPGTTAVIGAGDKSSSVVPSESGDRDTSGARFGAGLPEQASLARRSSAIGNLALITAGAAYLLLALSEGLPILAALRAAAAIAITQVLPGIVVWRAVRPRQGWWIEDLTMGLACGSVIAVGAQVVAGLSRVAWLAALIGPVVAAILLAIPAARSRIRGARTSPLPWWWGCAVATISLVVLPNTQDHMRMQPLSWPSGIRAPYVDAYFHLALSAQLANRGPTRFPWVESEPLGYHWFSHAWVAQVSNVSGTELGEVLLGFMPVFLPLVVTATVAIAAVRLAGRAGVGVVAALLAMVGGVLNVFGQLTPGYPVFVLSPSLGFGAPLIVAAVLTLALRWRGEMGRGAWAVLVLFCVGAAGSKGSTIPLLICGLGLSAFVMLIANRPRFLRVLLDLVVIVGCFLFISVFVLRGAGGGIGVDLWRAASQTALARTFGGVATLESRIFVLSVTAFGWIARSTGTLGLLTTRQGRRDPLTWTFLGVSVAVAAALVSLYHHAQAHYYFAYSAVPVMAIGSAVGIASLFDRLGSQQTRTAVSLGLLAGPLISLAPYALVGPLGAGSIRRAGAMVVAAMVIVALVAVIAAIAGSGRMLVVGATLVTAVLAGGVGVVVNSWAHREWSASSRAEVDATDAGAVSAYQIQAARWIREHSDVDDLVITNRHCYGVDSATKCDARRFVVAAFSERQVLVEGWNYTPMAARVADGDRSIYLNLPYWEPDRLALNDGFITDPTPEAAAALKDLGVRWISVDHTVPHASTLEPHATLRFTNPGVDVYELQ
jgi:hypothetical protein